MNRGFYPTWKGMMSRCYQPSHHNYPRYGARGIFVCNEWHDFKCFEAWAIETIGDKIKGITLDRVNNNGPYSPENCRWVDMKTQSNNRSNNSVLTIDGQSLTFTQWCNKYQISDDVVWERINKYNWDLKKALETPVNSFSSRQRYVAYNGQTHNLTEWCRILGVAHSTVYQRLAKGMSELQALGLEEIK